MKKIIMIVAAIILAAGLLIAVRHLMPEMHKTANKDVKIQEYSRDKDDKSDDDKSDVAWGCWSGPSCIE